MTGQAAQVFNTPIHDTNGFCIGSFCVIDTEPRQVTDDQKNLLISFALQAEALIALQLRQREKTIFIFLNGILVILDYAESK